ncbi:MAG: DUF4468 domain-containing protein [Bacteroidota bacterium]
MKKIILSSILFLFFYISSAQLIMVDGETGEYKYEEVIKVEGVSKQQIVERAEKWTNLYYKDSKITIDSAGTLRKLANYNFSWIFISKNISLQLFYDVEIKTKDNRYKYTFSNLKIGKIVLGELDAVELKNYIKRFPTKYQINIEEPIDAELTKAALSLENYITTQEFEKVDDDW